MIELMGPKGLGDAIYLRAIVLEFLRKAAEVLVYTSWPEVFADLPIAVRTRAEAWAGDHGDRDLRLISPNRMRRLGAGQGSEFATSCTQAGLPSPAALSLDWMVKDASRLDQIRARLGGRPICAYQPPKRSKNDLQEELSPNRGVFREGLERFARTHALVKIGHPEFIADGDDLPCDLDLVAPDTVALIFDLATIAGAFFGEACCFIPVLAQASGKPLHCLFARRALASADMLARGTVPEWVLHKRELATVLFDEPEEELCAS